MFRRHLVRKKSTEYILHEKSRTNFSWHEGLDFLDMIKMINFIRAEAKIAGRWPPDLTSKNSFQSEHWLMPQLEDDALLYSLHDVVGEDLEEEESGVTLGVGRIEAAETPQLAYNLARDYNPEDLVNKIAVLEQKVISAQRELEIHQQMLLSDTQLHDRLDNGYAKAETTSEARSSPHNVEASDTVMKSKASTLTVNEKTDASYFASYSGHGN